MKPVNVLLADDDEDDRMFFKEAFSEIRIRTQVTTVNDGDELMEYLKRDDIGIPHILFLDLNMPRKNGLDCLVEIRQIDRLKDMAIAIYSTSASEKDIEDTFVQGANIYIKKPGDFRALRKILEEVITIDWHYQTSNLNREHYLLSM